MRLLVIGPALLFLPCVAAGARSQPRGDESLAVDAYVRAGVPSPDRPWTGVDYQQASAALISVAKTDPRHLPRFRSARSGAVFAKITAPENFVSMSEASSAASIRLPDLLRAIEGLRTIQILYFNAPFTSVDLRDEMIELMAVSLEADLDVFAVMPSFLESLPPGERATPARTAGLQQAEKGLQQQVAGTVVSLRDPSFTPEMRARLASHLARLLPRTKPHLPPSQWLEVQVSVAKASESTGTELGSALEVLSRVIGRAD